MVWNHLTQLGVMKRSHRISQSVTQLVSDVLTLGKESSTSGTNFLRSYDPSLTILEGACHLMQRRTVRYFEGGIGKQVAANWWPHCGEDAWEHQKCLPSSSYINNFTVIIVKDRFHPNFYSSQMRTTGVWSLEIGRSGSPPSTIG